MNRIVYAVQVVQAPHLYLSSSGGRANHNTAPFAYTYPTVEAATEAKRFGEVILSTTPEQTAVVPVIVEAGSIKPATVLDFYREAIEADDAFSAIIVRVFGYGKNRWNIDITQHPEIAAAFEQKVRTFNAYERECRAGR